MRGLMNTRDAVTGLVRDLIGAPPESQPFVQASLGNLMRSLAIGGAALAIGSMMSRAITPMIAGIGQSIATQAAMSLGGIAGAIAPLMEKKARGPSPKDWSPRSGVCRCTATEETDGNL